MTTSSNSSGSTGTDAPLNTTTFPQADGKPRDSPEHGSNREGSRRISTEEPPSIGLKKSTDQDPNKLSSPISIKSSGSSKYSTPPDSPVSITSSSSDRYATPQYSPPDSPKPTTGSPGFHRTGSTTGSAEINRESPNDNQVQGSQNHNRGPDDDDDLEEGEVQSKHVHSNTQKSMGLGNLLRRRDKGKGRAVEGNGPINSPQDQEDKSGQNAANDVPRTHRSQESKYKASTSKFGERATEFTNKICKSKVVIRLMSRAVPLIYLLASVPFFMAPIMGVERDLYMFRSGQNLFGIWGIYE